MAAPIINKAKEAQAKMVFLFIPIIKGFVQISNILALKSTLRIKPILYFSQKTTQFSLFAENLIIFLQY